MLDGKARLSHSVSSTSHMKVVNIMRRRTLSETSRQAERLWSAVSHRWWLVICTFHRQLRPSPMCSSKQEVNQRASPFSLLYLFSTQILKQRIAQVLVWRPVWSPNVRSLSVAVPINGPLNCEWRANTPSLGYSIRVELSDTIHLMDVK